MDKNDGHHLSKEDTSPLHIRDLKQQVLALQNDNLIATPHSDHVTPVILESLPCRDKELLENNQGTAIYLGIKGKNLCLFCEESGGQVILKLKDMNIWDLYSPGNIQRKPFVFYQNQTNTTSTFESAAYHGWFMCTSNEKDRPVTMTQNRGANYNTDFYLISQTA
ncbi:interleukin-36 gamma-like [Petaurus breviceps papuanus]|uniref:interleukin-36 gamma-like n=1 Tax=Petaurus breviceps papuanus TaxID=3040969 RepID=UPI0036DBD21E